jgi:hypothetical protein
MLLLLLQASAAGYPDHQLVPSQLQRQLLPCMHVIRWCCQNAGVEQSDVSCLELALLNKALHTQQHKANSQTLQKQACNN